MNKKVSSSRNKHNGLSASEFQRNLYHWFEDHGVLADLRAHLRHQMVLALRETSLGPRPSSKSFSPKIQAINLLVAEFLLQQEHHYSLSVFTSEVPLLRSLPEFRTSDTKLSDREDTEKEPMPHFQQQDVWNILETLGFGIETQEGINIVQEYENTTEANALLVCILQSLRSKAFNVLNESEPGHSRITADHQKSRLLQETRATGSAKEELQKCQEELLEIKHQSFMKSQHIKQLQEQIKRFQDIEVKRVQAEEEAKFQQRLKEKEDDIQKEVTRKEQELNRKLLDAEEALTQQRLNVERDVKEKRKHLAQLAAQLHRQREELKCRHQQIEEKEDSLKNQEKTIEQTKQEEALKLAEKSSQLEIRQQQLAQEFERLSVEREAMGFMQQELEQRRLQILEASRSLEESQSEVRFLRGLQHQCMHLREELEATRLELDRVSQQNVHSSIEMLDKALQTQLSFPAEDNGSQERPEEKPSRHELMEMLRLMQQENEELRGHTEQQHLRIDELTNHAAQLARRLEDTEIAVTVLSNQASTSVDALAQTPTTTAGILAAATPAQAPQPPPPPPLPAFNPQLETRIMQSQQMGAGELSHFDPASVSSQRPVPASVIVTIAASAQTPVSSQTSRPHSRREWRRRPSRRVSMYHNGSSSEETSPTEQILEEARQRLRRLEEESEAVDRSYRDFRARQAQNLSASASLLFPMSSVTLLPPAQRSYDYRPFLFSSHNNLNRFSGLEIQTGPHSHLGGISSSRMQWVGEALSYTAAGQISTCTTASCISSIVSSRVSPSLRVTRPADLLISQSRSGCLGERQSQMEKDVLRSALDARVTASGRHAPDLQQTQAKSVSFRTPLRTTSIYNRPQIASFSGSSSESLQKHCILRGAGTTSATDETHSSLDFAINTAASLSQVKITANEFTPQDTQSSSSRQLTLSTSRSTRGSDDLVHKDISLPSLDLSSIHSHSDDNNVQVLTSKNEIEPKETEISFRKSDPRVALFLEVKQKQSLHSSESEMQLAVGNTNVIQKALSESDSSWILQQNKTKEKAINTNSGTVSSVPDTPAKTVQESIMFGKESDLPERSLSERENGSLKPKKLSYLFGTPFEALSAERKKFTATAAIGLEAKVNSSASMLAEDVFGIDQMKQIKHLVPKEDKGAAIASEQNLPSSGEREEIKTCEVDKSRSDLFDEQVIRVINLDPEEKEKPVSKVLSMLSSVAREDEEIFSASHHSASVQESGESSEHPISIGKISRGSSDVDKDDFW